MADYDAEQPDREPKESRRPKLREGQYRIWPIYQANIRTGQGGVPDAVFMTPAEQDHFDQLYRQHRDVEKVMKAVQGWMREYVSRWYFGVDDVCGEDEVAEQAVVTAIEELQLLLEMIQFRRGIPPPKPKRKPRK
jgi:hypothetical protein